MKKINNYIPCVFLTLILVFSFISIELLCVSKFALNENSAAKIVTEQALDVKVMAALEKHFTDKYSSTGIPADVYMNSLTPQWLNAEIRYKIIEGFTYLNGNSGRNANFNLISDYSQLKGSIRKFFEAYADENDIEKDAVFEAKIIQTQKNACETVSSYADVFKFQTLYDEGVLPQIAKFSPYLTPAIIAASTLCIVMIAIIILLCRKNLMTSLYWIGSALMISSLIILIPSIYIKAIRYFDGFAIKQEQVFTAFTTYLWGIINAAVTAGIIAMILGVVLILISIFLGRVRSEDLGNRS